MKFSWNNQIKKTAHGFPVYSTEKEWIWCVDIYYKSKLFILDENNQKNIAFIAVDYLVTVPPLKWSKIWHMQTIQTLRQPLGISQHLLHNLTGKNSRKKGDNLDLQQNNFDKITGQRRIVFMH